MKKRIKKLVTSCLCFLLATGLVGCSKGAMEETSTSTPVSAVGEVSEGGTVEGEAEENEAQDHSDKEPEETKAEEQEETRQGETEESGVE